MRSILFYILIVFVGIWIIEILIYLQDAYIRIKKLKKAHELALSTGKTVLNISCGPTDYGHVNADITLKAHKGFILYDKDKPLPFKNKEFAVAFSTHTLEHVDDLDVFLSELHRVADEVFIVYPLFDFLFWNPNHKWIFFSRNPKYHIKNPFYNPDQYKKKPIITTNNFIIKYFWKNKIRPELISKAKKLHVRLIHPLC